jgi:hypothetical protein
MDNKGKPKSLTVCDETNIFANADAHIETHVGQASEMRLSVPTLNPTVKNHTFFILQHLHFPEFAPSSISVKLRFQCEHLEAVNH